ncbi:MULTISPECIES: GTP-binding protein [Okeania]|uniref:Tr-type G domain-containing protein n=1 Tax=Okeania hirsuta TaxID=1458930 RepID=A0A3N6RM98_9CYAN|nr:MULTISPECIES: GTP-binding protein [Okeania]NET12153.1 hypothetical protein [Okeania sp. SIO1H6]NES77733.1 hypothetical protein [Okeania sp. SIO1H4]NES89530.1 hypothetical protein [Okeania sp. SIO2B9]NET21342.1 hypothetical protein [Okeania sp. SIO1H5]NET78054.1 hypothetical protein [Okeania sp. SIO1F9]
MIYKCGSITKRQISTFEKESLEMGKGSSKYAWVMDRTPEERERGMTLEVNYWRIKTEKYFCHLIDVPHAIDQVISAASQADAAILMVDAKKGSFEAGYAMDGQTRQHAFILYCLGVKQLIVAVNQMDAVNYDQERYNEIVLEMSELLKKIGYNPKAIRFIPISGWTGENFLEPASNMSWYQGTHIEMMNRYGNLVRASFKTLFEAINTFLLPSDDSGPMRTCVSRVFQPGDDHNLQIGNGRFSFMGHVERGILKPGDEVVFYPTHTNSNPCTARITNLEISHEETTSAKKGNIVNFILDGISHANSPHVGDVMVHKSDSSIGRIRSFQAQVIVQSHCGSIEVGYQTTVLINSAQVVVRLTAIERQLDRRGRTIAENPAKIEEGDGAIVTFEVQEPLTAEPFKDCSGLGRLILMDGNKNSEGVANLIVGVIREVERV